MNLVMAVATTISACVGVSRVLFDFVGKTACSISDGLKSIRATTFVASRLD
jgi:hypothetical protein